MEDIEGIVGQNQTEIRCSKQCVEQGTGTDTFIQVFFDKPFEKKVPSNGGNNHHEKDCQCHKEHDGIQVFTELGHHLVLLDNMDGIHGSLGHGSHHEHIVLVTRIGPFKAEHLSVVQRVGIKTF